MSKHMIDDSLWTCAPVWAMVLTNTQDYCLPPSMQMEEVEWPGTLVETISVHLGRGQNASWLAPALTLYLSSRAVVLSVEVKGD